MDFTTTAYTLIKHKQLMLLNDISLSTLRTKSHWLLINLNISVTVLFTELSYSCFGSYFQICIYEYKNAIALFS